MKKKFKSQNKDKKFNHLNILLKDCRISSEHKDYSKVGIVQMGYMQEVNFWGSILKWKKK